MISLGSKVLGVLLLLCCASVVSARSSNLDGDWQGTIGGTELTMLFHVKLHGKSSVDSLNQHRYGLLTDVSIEGNIVTITMLSAGMTFTGTLKGSQIKGAYTQTGSSYPLTLTRVGNTGPGAKPVKDVPLKPQRRPSGISPADLDGDWLGVLHQSSFSMVFHIKLNGKSTADSPHDHVFGYLVSVVVEGNRVKIAMPAAGMEVEGILQGSVIKGTYSQVGSSWPITLTRVKDSKHSSSLTLGPRAQDLNGDWEGVVQQVNFPVVFHINLSGKSTADNPQQHSYGYLINVSLESSLVRIEMPAAGMKFEGTLKNSQIKGTYSQLSSSWPLTLTKTKGPDHTVSRPSQ